MGVREWGGVGCHLASARDLGGEVRVAASARCQYGSITTICEQMFGGAFAPTDLKRKTCLLVAGGFQGSS